MSEPGHVFDILEGLNMQCLMDHIVLNVEHDEKMIAFYSKVLMFPTERVERIPCRQSAISFRKTEC